MASVLDPPAPVTLTTLATMAEKHQPTLARYGYFRPLRDHRCMGCGGHRLQYAVFVGSRAYSILVGHLLGDIGGSAVISLPHLVVSGRKPCPPTLRSRVSLLSSGPTFWSEPP